MLIRVELNSGLLITCGWKNVVERENPTKDGQPGFSTEISHLQNQLTEMDLKGANVGPSTLILFTLNHIHTCMRLCCLLQKIGYFNLGVSIIITEDYCNTGQASVYCKGNCFLMSRAGIFKALLDVYFELVWGSFAFCLGCATV